MQAAPPVGSTELAQALRHVARAREQSRAAHQRLRAAMAAQGDTYGTYVLPAAAASMEELEDMLRMARADNPGCALVVHVAVQAADHQGHQPGAEGGSNGSRQHN